MFWSYSIQMLMWIFCQLHVLIWLVLSFFFNRTTLERNLIFSVLFNNKTFWTAWRILCNPLQLTNNKRSWSCLWIIWKIVSLRLAYNWKHALIEHMTRVKSVYSDTSIIHTYGCTCNGLLERVAHLNGAVLLTSKGPILQVCLTWQTSQCHSLMQLLADVQPALRCHLALNSHYYSACTYENISVQVKYTLPIKPN